MSTEIQTKLIRYWIQHPTLYDRSRSDYKKLHKRNVFLLINILFPRFFILFIIFLGID